MGYSIIIDCISKDFLVIYGDYKQGEKLVPASGHVSISLGSYDAYDVAEYIADLKCHMTMDERIKLIREMLWKK